MKRVHLVGFVSIIGLNVICQCAPQCSSFSLLHSVIKWPTGEFVSTKRHYLRLLYGLLK